MHPPSLSPPIPLLARARRTHHSPPFLSLSFTLLPPPARPVNLALFPPPLRSPDPSPDLFPTDFLPALHHLAALGSPFFGLAVLALTTAFTSSPSVSALTAFKMPAMSPTMTEGGIATWKKQEGETFSAGDVLLEIVRSWFPFFYFPLFLFFLVVFLFLFASVFLFCFLLFFFVFSFVWLRSASLLDICYPLFSSFFLLALRFPFSAPLLSLACCLVVRSIVVILSHFHQRRGAPGVQVIGRSIVLLWSELGPPVP